MTENLALPNHLFCSSRVFVEPLPLIYLVVLLIDERSIRERMKQQKRAEETPVITP